MASSRRPPSFSISQDFDPIVVVTQALWGIVVGLDERGLVESTRDSAQNFAKRQFHFLLDMEAQALAESGGNNKFHHLYEWGASGDPRNRLIELVFPAESAGAGTAIGVGQIRFHLSSRPVPIRGGPRAGEDSQHIFAEKARVMEEYTEVFISPRNRPFLAFWVDSKTNPDLGINSSSSVTQSGGLVITAKTVHVPYTQTYGALSMFYNEAFWPDGLIHQHLVEEMHRAEAIANSKINAGLKKITGNRSGKLTKHVPGVNLQGKPVSAQEILHKAGPRSSLAKTIGQKIARIIEKTIDGVLGHETGEEVA